MGWKREKSEGETRNVENPYRISLAEGDCFINEGDLIHHFDWGSRHVEWKDPKMEYLFQRSNIVGFANTVRGKMYVLSIHVEGDHIDVCCNCNTRVERLCPHAYSGLSKLIKEYGKSIFQPTFNNVLALPERVTLEEKPTKRPAVKARVPIHSKRLGYITPREDYNFQSPDKAFYTERYLHPVLVKMKENPHPVKSRVLTVHTGDRKEIDGEYKFMPKIRFGGMWVDKLGIQAGDKIMVFSYPKTIVICRIEKSEEIEQTPS